MRAFSGLNGFLTAAVDARLLRAKLHMILDHACFPAIANLFGVAAVFAVILIQPETFGDVGWFPFGIAMGWQVYRSTWGADIRLLSVSQHACPGVAAPCVRYGSQRILRGLR